MPDNEGNPENRQGWQETGWRMRLGGE